MVAAWINALTGVGPSIASGSHTCSGTCADFPTAPPNTSSADAVSTGPPNVPAPIARKISSNRSDPVCRNRSRMPIIIEKSPTRVTTNAFSAAREAAGRSNQNPIRRYEHRPTSSHAA